MGDAETLGPVAPETHSCPPPLLASLTAMRVWERHTGPSFFLIAKWEVPSSTLLGCRDERRETHSPFCTLLGAYGSPMRGGGYSPEGFGCRGFRCAQPGGCQRGLPRRNGS